VSGVVTAWVLSAGLTLGGGPPLIRALRRRGIVQTVREEAPARHAAKTGTPTMGGLLMIGAALVAAVVAASGAHLPTRHVLTGVVVVALFALVGAVDDLVAVARHRNLGLRAREKLLLHAPLALAFGVYVLRAPDLGGAVSLPGTPLRFDLGWGYPVFSAVVLVGMVNAVNLTDGLDGLAAGTSAIAAGALGVLASRGGALPAAVLAAAVAGAATGFLWHNAHPARVFMGDVGSHGLGAGVAVAGILAKQELLTVLVGGVFVAEALSVALQVVYFRATGGKRLFRMSPIHHHFELSGWTETQTVVRFWVCAALLAAVGVGLRP
jgi:phospho-N-acetylmuramoyl-pentapeptide-transferase